MNHRPFKNRLYPQFARVGGALASEKRLELLDLLAQAPRHVEALAAETEMSVANVSQHLQVLRNARLVEAERDGNRVLYRLASEDVLRLWLMLRTVAERQFAEVQAIAHEYAVDGADAQPYARDRVEQLAAQGEVLLLDVRPPVEYAHGHLPGALSVPIDDLPRRLQELPRDRPIVAYCRGAYCLFADEAVALLRRHGYEAFRLEGGWPEWQAEQRPVAR
ncbi:MAG TPA: metalloregulator ArsR/SmtB family transcription factor [Dehalococcoidia bacterium]|nr:metalloregulator ArsR/SmtB family transcription factor [Dehalococcoidia bacterium]